MPEEAEDSELTWRRGDIPIGEAESGHQHSAHEDTAAEGPGSAAQAAEQD